MTTTSHEWHTRIPKGLWDVFAKRDLSPIQRLVMLAMLHFADSSGDGVRPGKTRLAKMTGLTPRTVQRARHELEAMGLVRVIAASPGRISTYRVVTDDHRCQTITGDPVSPTGDPVSPGGRQTITGTGDPVSPDQPHDQIQDQIQEHPQPGGGISSPDEPRPDLSADDILSDFDIRWSEHRKRVEAWKTACKDAESALDAEQRAQATELALDEHVKLGNLAEKHLALYSKAKIAPGSALFVFRESHPIDLDGDPVVFGIGADSVFLGPDGQSGAKLCAYSKTLSDAVGHGVKLRLLDEDERPDHESINGLLSHGENSIAPPDRASVEAKALAALGWDAPPSEQVDPRLDRYVGHSSGYGNPGFGPDIGPLEPVLRVAELMAAECKVDIGTILDRMAKYPADQVMDRARAVEQVAQRERVNSPTRLFKKGLMSGDRGGGR